MNANIHTTHDFSVESSILVDQNQAGKFVAIPRLIISFVSDDKNTVLDLVLHPLSAHDLADAIMEKSKQLHLEYEKLKNAGYVPDPPAPTPEPSAATEETTK